VLARPDVFTAVAAFSARAVSHRITSRARTARVRHYLAAAPLETGFRLATRQWTERLQCAGLACHNQQWVGGITLLVGPATAVVLAWLLPMP